MTREVEPPVAWDCCDPHTRQAANVIDLALQNSLPDLTSTARVAVVDRLFAELEDSGLVLRLAEMTAWDGEAHFDWCRRSCPGCGRRFATNYCSCGVGERTPE